MRKAVFKTAFLYVGTAVRLLQRKLQEQNRRYFTAWNIPVFFESRKCSNSLFSRNSGREIATHLCWNYSKAYRDLSDSLATL